MRCSPKQMTLGELIAALRRKDSDARVTFGFGGYVPCGIDSYRGYYEDLAIKYEQKYGITVAEVLKMLEGAIGDVFTGYKGGEYLMNDDTAVWVANYGCSHGVAIVDVVEKNHVVWLKTELIDA